MSKARQMRLTLVRSGRTTWDQDGRLCGATDLPLCGPCAADLPARVAEMIRTIPATDLVLSGPDEASRSTARAFADALDAQIRAIDDLSEVSFGLWEGSLRKEIEERNPSVFRRWEDDPASVTPPQGESIEDAAERLLPALTRALAKAKLIRGGAMVVLRPFAWAVVEARVSGRGTGDVAGLIRSGELMTTRTVESATLAEVPVGMGVAS